jgi:SOS-response transcriptional repressor LexA
LTPAVASSAPAPEELAGCSGGESFALRVLGDDMAPEFNDGEIIIVEPDGALKDGAFVLARHDGEWIFRQLCRCGEGWVLHALNPARTDLSDLPLPDLAAVHGVIIQKAVPGRRRLSKFYV